MIEYIFQRVVIMSLCGTLASLCLLLLKPVTKKLFSSKWHYYTYIAVLLVFLLPVSVKPKADDTVPEISEAQSITIQVSVSQSDEKCEYTTPNRTGIHREIANIFSKLSQIGTLSYIWVSGVILSGTFVLLCYVIFKRKVKKDAYLLTTEKCCTSMLSVYKSKEVKSPVLIGIFKPELYLPDADLSENDYDNILVHECVHLKRRDILIKWICVFARTVHWFNPFIYIISKKAEEECEISCDKQATTMMDDESKRAYCETILSLVSKSTAFSPSLGMGDTKKNLERRFVAIMHENKTGKKTIIISSFITAAILLTALTVSATLGGKAKEQAKAETNEDIVITADSKTNSEIPGSTQSVNSTENIKLHPVTGEVIADYSQTELPISAGFDEERHPAVDLKLAAGTPVTCPFEGMVLAAEYNPDKGNYIEILSLDGTTRVLFAHLDKMYVNTGDNANAGDEIGTVGTTGMSTGPHLHVEVYEDGSTVDPTTVFTIAFKDDNEILSMSCKPQFFDDSRVKKTID